LKAGEPPAALEADYAGVRAALERLRTALQATLGPAAAAG